MKATTKRRIAQKFFEIAQKKNIDRITVQDIANECHITRQSFYYYFQDIWAIIEWVLNDYVKNLLKNIEFSTGIDEILKNFVESIPEYSNVINALMKSKEHSQFEKLLKSVLCEYVEGIIEQKNLFSDLTVSELKTLISFYTYALLGLLVDYSGKKFFDHEKLAKHLHRIFTGEIKFGCT